MAFLKAYWRDLLMINWAIPPERVLPWVPPGCEVDSFEGQTFASLVAFQFRETRVLGLALPGHVDFEEVNLRLYVKRTTDEGEVRRGVVFVREIVPRRLIAWVARTIYGEPYQYMPMSHRRTLREDGGLQLEYVWGNHRLEASASPTLSDLQPGSETHFIAEHYWGYTARPGGTSEYRVNHPSWRWRGIESLRMEVDMAALYGPEWADLTQPAVASQFLAEGSEVTVDPCGRM